MAIGKILPRGQLTLPRDVRRAAGLAPGDTVTFRVTGEGTIEIKALPRLTLQDLLEQFPIEGDFAEDFARGGWQDDAAREIIEKMEQ
jgi:AbrB family looped-hinge helix DNA binding protein